MHAGVVNHEGRSDILFLLNILLLVDHWEKITFFQLHNALHKLKPQNILLLYCAMVESTFTVEYVLYSNSFDDLYYSPPFKGNYCIFVLHYIYFTAATFYFINLYFTPITYDSLLLQLNLVFFPLSSLIVEKY